MNLRQRTPTRLGLLTVLLLAAAAAGCIGDASEEAPAATDARGGQPETANATDEDEQARTEAPEPTVDERSVDLSGSGTGKGLEPMEGSCFNCAWVVSEGARTDLAIPDSYEGGSIEFSWEGGESVGGMWLWVRDADEETVHVFHVDASPFEVDLEADDGRLAGAEEVLILPADTPAAAHVTVEWSGAFTFLVPQDGGQI